MKGSVRILTLLLSLFLPIQAAEMIMKRHADEGVRVLLQPRKRRRTHVRCYEQRTSASGGR